MGFRVEEEVERVVTLVNFKRGDMTVAVNSNDSASGGTLRFSIHPHQVAYILSTRSTRFEIVYVLVLFFSFRVVKHLSHNKNWSWISRDQPNKASKRTTSRSGYAGPAQFLAYMDNARKANPSTRSYATSRNFQSVLLRFRPTWIVITDSDTYTECSIV